MSRRDSFICLFSKVRDLLDLVEHHVGREHAGQPCNLRQPSPITPLSGPSRGHHDFRRGPVMNFDAGNLPKATG